MRKHVFFILVIFVSIAGCRNQGNDEKKIRDLLQRQAQDWNHGNIELYMQGYLRSDSLIFIGKSGPKYGWETTLAAYKKSYPDKKAMGHLHFNIIKVELLSDKSAFVIGQWTLDREKDRPTGYFTLLLKKTGEGWKITADHSS